MKTYLSTSEAARQFQLNRKTVQRYMDAGKVPWHGDVRRGRNAKGIDVEELKKALNAGLSDGRSTGRREFGSYLAKVQKLLESCIEPLVSSGRLSGAASETLAKRVLCIYLSAALNGADLDFLLCCIERLTMRDQAFVFALLGEEVNPLHCGELCIFMADRLKKLAESHSLDESKYSFVGWWRQLVEACFKAPLAVEVAIVTDRASGGATIELVPKWLNGAPSGALPMEGGHHSVATVRWAKGVRTRVDRVAKKVAKHLGDMEASEQLNRIGALLSLKDEFLVVCRGRWNWVLSAGVGHNILDDKGLSLPDEDQDEARRVFDGLTDASRKLGLSLDDTRELLLTWRRLTSDVSNRASIQFDDSRPTDKEFVGVIVSRATIAKVFGVSRWTLAKWIRDAGRLINVRKPPSRKKKQINTCLPPDESSGEADGQACPDDGDNPSGELDLEEDINDILHPNGIDAD